MALSEPAFGVGVVQLLAHFGNALGAAPVPGRNGLERRVKAMEVPAAVA